MIDSRARRTHPVSSAADAAPRRSMRGSRLAARVAAAALGLGLAGAPQLAAAGPGVQVGGKAGTSGTSGSASSSGKKSGFKLPERVAQGNAISLLMPVQVGFVGYIPRVRIAFQYDRQIQKAHWVFVGVASLLDRGDFDTFRLPNCGLGDSVRVCNKGTVAGFDIYAGYAHKWYLRDNPYLVPIARGAIGGGAWWYPDITGSRQQSRESTFAMSLRPGGGLRFFPILDLAIGIDVNFALGFTVSKDTPLAMPTAKKSGFLFGIEILPLIIEYRF